MGNLFSDNIPVYIEPTQQTTRYQHLSFLTRPFQREKKVNDVGGGEGEGDGEDVGAGVELQLSGGVVHQRRPADQEGET